MEDEEDVKKMTEFINKQKSVYQNNYQIEFEDFVSFKQDTSDQEFEDELLDEVPIETFYINKETEQELVFTEEEQNIIESCNNPELKNLLILNRSKNMQLIKLHKKLQDILTQCDQEIEEKRTLLKTIGTKQLNQRTFIWKLAAPYFKDKKFFPCPLNEEAIKKRNGQELSIYELTSSPKWTPIEFDRLTNAVKCNFNINRQNDLVTKISSLKSKMQSAENEDNDVLEEIIRLKVELEELKNDDKIPGLNSDQFINWYKVAETFLKDKHTALECQAVWHYLVHPEINKSEWSEEENKQLDAIAARHSYQNWNDISDELATNRTGFTTCLHYFSKLCDKFKKSKFTPEEDAFLLEVIDIYRVGTFIPWNKVVCHFNKRSRHQLYHRYTYFLSQNHVKRGKFSEAEDILLIILVNKFGRNFKKCSEYMLHRSQVQLKSRYNSNLQRHIRKGTFTSEDDKIIYDYAQKNGEKNWTGLTTILKRCNAQIRQRYKLIKTFLRENPESTVSDIPKRRHRFDEANEGQHNFLNYVADRYKDVDYVPTLSMIEESLQAGLHSEIKFKNIDAMLTEFFSSSMKIKNCSAITEANLTEASENVESVLTTLGAKLEIPKDLDCNAYFDNIDLEILERIKQQNETQVDRLIPPNISTLVGLRSLIIKHKEYKGQKDQKCDNKTTWVENTDSEEQSLYKEQFSKRFDMLFSWSAILSLEKPNQNLPKETVELGIKRPNATELDIERPESQYSVKKRKIDVSALANLSQHPQLQLVDKSIVEKLIKKNNINVIRLDSMTKLNGFPLIKRVEETQTTASNDDIIEDVTDSDVQDVERLNLILKSMKTEKTSVGEEYETIKDDVQLLKEVLTYEKIKVKTDPDRF